MPAVTSNLAPLARGAVARFAYSPAEAAALLSVTRKHIYTLMARGELRSTLIGRSRRIPRTELERLAGLDSGPDAA